MKTRPILPGHSEGLKRKLPLNSGKKFIKSTSIEIIEPIVQSSLFVVLFSEINRKLNDVRTQT
jgi:hypothetical protein